MSISLETSKSKLGFHKWIRLPIDDLPLIRPPKRHMLAQMTGGIQELYAQLKKSRSRPGSSHKESPLPNCLRRAITNTGGDLGMKVKDDTFYNKDSKSLEHESKNQILDNEDLNLYTDEEGEFVPSEDMPLLAHRYKYVNVLARGQSALIIKALDTFAKNKPIAIKVLHRVYKPIGSQEADILIELDRADPWCHVPFSRLKNQFIYGPHYCLVFESLSPTPLYTHYKQKNIKGADSIPQVQNLCIKLLSVLGFLHKQNVIHADFKPENILLKDENDMNSVTVIDFGNSLRNTEEELSLYYSDYELQTLLYRAPEVIFGLKFSLQIDLWSLGCLLAECFIGQPLFIGKTKHDMLSKITKLLGPFPKEFSDGDCACYFKEFINTPLSQYQRVENLKKKLNCKNVNFLLLLEQLLTYSPQLRINPFEAASHSFVAKINPFLYLSSDGEKSYPRILLTSQTYPHVPDRDTNENDDKLLIDCRLRLAAYSIQPNNDIKPVIHPELTEVVKQEKVGLLVKGICSPVDINPKISQPQPLKKESSSHSIQHKKDNSESASKFEKIKFLDRNYFQNDSFSKKETSQDTGSNVHKEFGSIKSPGEVSNERQSIGSPDMQHSVTSESPMQSPVNSPPLNNISVKIPASQINPMNNMSVEVSRQSNKLLEKGKEPPQDDVSRTDVKQTLKSMGLRCEDFTISVYSKEQAHAILRKQGVEVTNHNQNKLNIAATPNRLPKVTPNVHPSVSVVRREQQMKVAVPQQSKDEDDDDCVILDPPEGSKKPTPAPAVVPPPLRRFPQQFQLMGTTVQVSRGVKRPMRGLPSRIPTKRGRPSYYNFMNEGRPHVEENSEASVQDTLNRLKNYNISITCKRNASQLNPAKDFYKDDEYDNSDSQSEEEQDLAKFLECEINEKLSDENPKHDFAEKTIITNTTPTQEEKSDDNNLEQSEKEPEDGNISDGNKCSNDEENNSQPPTDLDSKSNTVDNSVANEEMETNNGSICTPLNSPAANESKAEDRLSPSIEDDINEELEKQLLDSSNFGKDLDDIEDEGLDSLEKEL